MASVDANLEESYNVINDIGSDISAFELQLSFLVSSTFTYRRESVLKPCPPIVLQGTDDASNYKRLEDALKSLPNTTSILTGTKLTEDSKSLLKWLMRDKHFKLATVGKDQFEELKKKTGQVAQVPAPHFLFEIKYSDAAQTKFDELRGGRQLFYAYHGSRLENFYSIIHHGLCAHLNKNSLFGEGTYLSCELAVTLHYAPMGSGWTHSLLAPTLSCIAFCEIIDDPASVKCQEKSPLTPSRGRARGAQLGDVPDKYYVVSNNEMVRVKYLLVYGQRNPPAGQLNGPANWIRQNKFAVLICLYALVLLGVGFFRQM